MEKLVAVRWESLKQTFEGKHVFLTGHTGFKGTWLLLLLKELGAEVTGYSLEPEKESLYEAVQGDLLCDSILADVRNADKVNRRIQQAQPDIIIHFAAQSLVLPSYKNPVETYATNVMGTAHVLDALRSLEKPCTTLIITTDKVYENLETMRPYEESDRLGGHDPYSNSKACAELVTQSFRDSFFPLATFDQHKKSIATARSGNVIGGGDWSENRIIPDLIRSLERNETLMLRSPNAVRPWQHVLDPLSGYLTLIQHMINDPKRNNEAYNFGPTPDDVLTVEDLVKASIQIFGKGHYDTVPQANTPHEAGLLLLDNSKAAEKLNWKPHFTSQEAIHETISWYATFKEQGAKEVTTAQIHRFFEGQ